MGDIVEGTITAVCHDASCLSPILAFTDHMMLSGAQVPGNAQPEFIPAAVLHPVRPPAPLPSG
jgi:hypothetical protein